MPEDKESYIPLEEVEEDEAEVLTDTDQLEVNDMDSLFNEEDLTEPEVVEQFPEDPWANLAQCSSCKRGFPADFKKCPYCGTGR